MFFIFLGLLCYGAQLFAEKFTAQFHMGDAQCYTNSETYGSCQPLRKQRSCGPGFASSRAVCGLTSLQKRFTTT